jgi:hypothetical protein
MHFRKPQAPATSPVTSQSVREELELNEFRLSKIDANLGESEAALSALQAEYNSAMDEYLSGDAAMPDRSKLQIMIDQLDGLRRVRQQFIAKLATLRGSLADAELLDAAKAGRQQLPLLDSAATAKVEEIAEHAKQLRRAEDELLTILFDGRAGLRQPFPGELCKDAEQIRVRIASKLMAVARQFALRVADRFEAPGSGNYCGEPQESILYFKRPASNKAGA